MMPTDAVLTPDVLAQAAVTFGAIGVGIALTYAVVALYQAARAARRD